jgi:hypothetical protein
VRPAGVDHGCWTIARTLPLGRLSSLRQRNDLLPEGEPEEHGMRERGPRRRLSRSSDRDRLEAVTKKGLLRPGTRLINGLGSAPTCCRSLPLPCTFHLPRRRPPGECLTTFLPIGPPPRRGAPAYQARAATAQSRQVAGTLGVYGVDRGCREAGMSDFGGVCRHHPDTINRLRRINGPPPLRADVGSGSPEGVWPVPVPMHDRIFRLLGEPHSGGTCLVTTPPSGYVLDRWTGAPPLAGLGP